MKFLSVFSTVLCALALRINALPVTEEPYALVSRAADQTTAAYDRAIAIKSDMIPGIRYVFTIKFPVDKKEKDAKMLELTEKLGFKHIILMIGEVKITELGKKTERYKKKDFVTSTFDLQIIGGKVESVQGKWKPSSASTTYEKTTKKTDPQMKTIGLDFVKGKSYEYTIPGVNCDGYVKNMLAIV